MNAVKELEQIAKRLEELAERGDDATIANPLLELQESAEEVGKAASGSWLGYQALVYYQGLKRPPPDAHFDQEWGSLSYDNNRTSGSWRNYDRETVDEAIRKRAGNPDLGLARKFDDDAREEIETCKFEILSILQTHTDERDPHLENVRSRVDEVLLLSREEVIKGLAPRYTPATRDHVALNQGQTTPPHVYVLAGIRTMRHTRKTIVDLINLVRHAVSHISRKQAVSHQRPAVGKRIFIGHGHSAAWRELKDFVEDRLGLPTDEFNRVPIAGIHNTERLRQMLKSAAMAFLVMTAEDERQDGTSHARLNVVHEAGLFQGRLGFNRAIVLLEEGCEGFSNIDGLGQLRFAKGEIGSKFEEIRRVLEREGLVKADETGQALPDDSTA